MYLLRNPWIWGVGGKIKFCHQHQCPSQMMSKAQIHAYYPMQNLGTVSSLTSSKNLFVKLHGAFMIAAWVLFASVGMFLARYFKQTWTGSKCCKLDQWFIWHRFLMVTTWGLTIAGVILIFLELQVGTECTDE